MSETQAVNMADIVHVLRLARDGWPEGCTWETYGFAAAVWHGYLGGRGEEEVTLTDEGRAFLAKFGRLYPEEAGRAVG
ncbi:hypothetical protein [Paractinoplanes toevensis]|uniref:Uncharacterized protein n=1 Tax=Paractinoplanes toevensis TaxID=571911 RepID=A0A919T750_9ACTN|nr:hypothetical protein [Actinoplanes toevensis]GIM88796.1 hypothetical protein Ato02nite_005890 [Actinoplanes toevensis]